MLKYRYINNIVITFLFLVFFTGCISKSSNTISTSMDFKNDAIIDAMIKQISPDSIRADITKLVSFKDRQTMADTTSNTTGIGAARHWIYAQFERYSKESGRHLQVRYDTYLQKPAERINKPTRIVDVVATLPGTQPASKKRIYIVSGHYDSRVTNIMNDTSFAPGADDDGSGVACSLELARVMSQHKFDATIMFVTVDGEEEGLYGSTHLAEEAKANNWDVQGMITNDIIGSSTAENGKKDAKEVRVFAAGIPPTKKLTRHDRILLMTGGENDTQSREFARFIREVTQQYVPGMYVNIIYRSDRYLRGGDHMPFLKDGYSAVRFTEPHENFHHQHQNVRMADGIQYGDLPQFVNYNYTARVIRINLATLANLALAPAEPQNVGMDVSKLTNSTTLKWSPNTEPDLAGYIIVWRKTDMPYWQHQKFVGNVTEYTLKNISKDNYLFGVEAIDKGGHHSPAVYPLPVR